MADSTGLVAEAAVHGLGHPSHLGQIVEDLDAAMGRYTDEFGVVWASTVSYGRGRHRSRFTCGRVAGVLIELIEEVPGSIWSSERGAPIHHIAYWTDNLVETQQELQNQGLTLEAAGATFA
jgi:hypothetical protein